MISLSPSEEQQMMINMVKQFAVNEMRKIYRECDESGEIPSYIAERAWELGLISGCLPEEYGGVGDKPSAVTGALVAEELAWGDLSMTLDILRPALVAFPLLEWGSDRQKKQYLPLFSPENPCPKTTAALIEPRFDFDPDALATTAEPSGDHYVLSGEKCFVPLAAESDLMLVYARDNGSVQGFFVEKNTPGLEIGEREKNMGIKALPTYELSLHDCRVPRQNRLGEAEGCDFDRIINRSRVALSAMAVGVARAAFEYSRDYAKERVQFGEPIAHRQAIAFMLAEMAIEIDATRLMTWETAWKLDQGQEATKEASLTKRYADDMVLMVADRAVQILGGHGYIRDHPVELWLRNGRGFATFDGLAVV